MITYIIYIWWKQCCIDGSFGSSVPSCTCRGVARVRHMGPRPQPQRLCSLKFHELALGAATLSQSRLELPNPKIVLAKLYCIQHATSSSLFIQLLHNSP